MTTFSILCPSRSDPEVMVKLSSVRVWPWSFLTVVPASTVMSLAFTLTVPVTGRTLNLAGRILPAESLITKSAALLNG